MFLFIYFKIYYLIKTFNPKFKNIILSFLAGINEIVKSLHYQPDTRCLQSCNEFELKNIGIITSTISNNTPLTYGTFSLEMYNENKFRYIRSVKKTKLDMVGMLYYIEL